MYSDGQQAAHALARPLNFFPRLLARANLDALAIRITPDRAGRTLQKVWRLTACVSALLVAGCGTNDTTLPDVVDYNFHIRPILSDRCYKCHGPDDNARKAELRLHTQAGVYAASRDDSLRYIIVPGSVQESKLMAHITSEDPKTVMPPPESNLSLTKHEIALIRRWIEQGATWKPHWAFTPPVPPERPAVQREDWIRNDIDAFVLRTLEEQRLKPSPETDKAKLLRRATLDLTGLPPSIEALDSFLADERPDAYEEAIRALLKRPAYGERMASMWLDVSRYADTHGYQDDRPRTMWPWRDWVIRAFNDNMPYDQFVTWQLAGDLLENANYEQRLATGFNRNHAITQEGGVVPAEYITEYVADRTNTMATAFLGLTMECARCHDHKYDPILQREYYQLFAFFNAIDEQAPINYFDLSPRPSMRMEDEALEALIASTAEAISNEEAALEAHAPEDDYAAWKALGALDVAAGLERDLLAYYALDGLDNLTTANMVGPYAVANTGLQNELDPPATVQGRQGQALAFDGVNFLNLGAEADFDWYDRFSIAFWVHPEPQEKDAALLSKRVDEQKRHGYEVYRTADGHLGVRLLNDNALKIEVVSAPVVPLRIWSHIAATYDGSGRAEGLALHINGAAVRTIIVRDSLARKSILNGNDLLAGHWSHRKKTRGDIEGLKGAALDEIRIYARELSALEVAHLADKPPSESALKDHYRIHHDAAHAAHVTRLDSLRRSWREVPHIMVMEDMETPRPTFVLARGAYDAPMDSVGPDTPEAILSMPAHYPRNRLGLVYWLMDPQNPLTARVAVNRFWQMIFGEGLVHTPEDFGSQGAFPTHPMLLDYLATAFIASGWDIKALLYEIVTSATYRQSNAITASLAARDPDNMYLARGPKVRLSAEMMRDNALFASGLLHQEIGGEPVRPYQPAGLWKALANQVGENRYRPGRGHDLYRRSLYTYWKRTIPPPAMLTFDAPERTVCTVERQSTATPLQSLVLLNDPQFVESARVLAERIVHDRALDDEERITRAFRLLTSRVPTREERASLKALLSAQKTAFSNDSTRAARLASVGNSRPGGLADDVTLAAWTVVASTIMNLDEAQYR